MEPANFDEMRRGCWDIDARIEDMDLGGRRGVGVLPVAHRRVRRDGVLPVARTPTSGWRASEAWNDWHLDVWAGTHPGRIIPLQITWLHDPDDRGRRRSGPTPSGASGR